MFHRATAILLIGILVSGSNVNAARLTPLISAEGMSIVLRGDIELGDAETLERLIETLDKDGHSPRRLLLDSPGGNLLGGIGLARLVRRHGDLATMVTYGSTCASVCFLVFASGHEKFADYNSFVGVHGVADKDGHVSERTTAATMAMAHVSEELGVPAPINAKIVTTPPNEIVWLTHEDLKSMDAIMVGRPIQSSRGGSRESLPQRREPVAEAMDLSQSRDLAVQIRQALDAAQRTDYTRAVRLWRLLAEKGDGPSQYNLGQMYYTGQGIRQNFTEAFKWYSRAAEQGIADAQINVGIAYAIGRGIQQNLPKAYKWLNVAAATYATDRERAQAVNARDLIAARMTAREVAEAERQTRDWNALHANGDFSN